MGEQVVDAAHVDLGIEGPEWIAGLGFERLLFYITGMANVRDLIPFPRTPKHAPF